MTTIFGDPREWKYVFTTWEEWASGPDDMELPEIYMENSYIRTKVRELSDLFYESVSDDAGLKLDELDYELSKCEHASDFRVRLSEIKQVLLEAQAIAERLKADELEPDAKKGKRFKSGRNVGSWKDIKKFLFDIYCDKKPKSFKEFWGVIEDIVGLEMKSSKIILQEVEECDGALNENEIYLIYIDSKGTPDRKLKKKQARNYFTEFRKKEKF